VVSSEEATRKRNFILTENSIADIPLPFPRKEMLNKVTNAFQNYQVTKEVGQQDGPDFPVYLVKYQEETVLFFAMNWEDTLKLDAVYIESPVVIDEYGLTVGRSLDNIKELRKGKLKTQEDYHNHTYMQVEDSHIIYELTRDESSPDTPDVNKTLEVVRQNASWEIAKIIWRQFRPKE